MDKLRVFTTFSGYASQCLALDRLKRNYPNFDYKLVGWSEIDKFAIKAHDVLFPCTKNYGDICEIDWTEVPDFDLFTYSSPCQDFSQAGKQRGGEKGSGTRSSLLWQCERAIEAKRPKFCLMENVRALVSQKFVKLFNQWQLTLEKLGYRNYAKVLNAKDYGVPQNRERIFLVSIRNDVNMTYYFPQPFRLEHRLKDLLEKEVDERYYVSEKALQGYELHNKRHEAKGTGFIFKSKDINIDGGGCANALRANASLAPTDNHIIQGDGLYTDTTDDFFRGGLDGVSRSLKANMHDAGVCVEDNFDGLFIKELYGDVKMNIKFPRRYRIRKLTERECFRLMGVDDADIDKLQGIDYREALKAKDRPKIDQAGISRSQQYKLAGNSIVVDVLYHIFRKMFVETRAEAYVQLELF